MKLEKRATLVASGVAFILLLIKFSVGILSGSVAILASAIDSLLDIAVSLFNYFALQTADKKADERFNYGRGKVEAIAAVIEGVIITISGLFILYLSINKIITNNYPTHMDEAIYVMIASTLITGALVLFLNYVAKKTHSMVIKADVLHYKVDLYSNGGILLALFLISFTQWMMIDAIAGIIIAIYIIYSAYKLIKEGILILLDAALDHEMVQKIVDVIDKQKEITSHHFLKTRQAGKDIFVSVHLVFNDKISLLQAHQISDRVEHKLEKIDTHYNWKLSIHLDPHDDSEQN